MAIENFTTYTEVDPGTDISKTADTVTWAGLRRLSTSYVYKDKTLNFFAGDFEHLFEVRITAVYLDGLPTVWRLSNAVADVLTDRTAGSLLYLMVVTNGTIFRLYEYDSGTPYYDAYNAILNTVYYIKVKRDESVGTYGTIYCYIYSDSGRTNLLDTLEVALHTSKKDYRYIYPLSSFGPAGGDYTTDGYVKDLDLQLTVALAVTTDAADDIEDTTATLNGTVTDDGGLTIDYYGFVWGDSDEGNPGDVDPGGPAGTWENGWKSGEGDYGEAAFDHALTGLSPGVTIYVRACAHNSEGWSYGDAVSFITKPAAPTNIVATNGVHTDKVVITWNKSTGATGYKIYEGENLLDTVGDVATYDDEAAPAGSIDNAGNVTASDGTSASHVTLSLAGESVTNGASRTYKVVAVNASGDSDASGTDTGYRSVGAISYQWQRSAADSDASYSNITGGTTDPYNDTSAPASPAARYFQCVLTSAGSSNSPATSDSDRGYKAAITGAAVTTQAVTDISSKTATGNGNIVDTGGVNATKRGVCYSSINTVPTVDDDKVEEEGSFGTGAFTASLTGLVRNTKYYVRAFMYPGASYVYGGVKTFTTLKATETLAAAQVSVARTPYIKMLFTSYDGETTYDLSFDSSAYGKRIILIDHYEEPYNDYAIVVLRNYDLALPTNLCGYWVEIGYGDVTDEGNEYELTPRLWVKHHQIVSAAGRLIMILELEGIWAKMRETKLRIGNPPYYTVTYSTDTVKDIITIILAELDPAVTLELLAEDDGIMDTLTPAFELNTIQPFEDAGSSVYRLLKMTLSYLRHKADLKAEIKYPQTTDTADFTFHSFQQATFREYTNRKNLILPNHIYLFANAGVDNLWTDIITAEATDAVSIAAYGDVPDIALAPEIDNQTDADNRALAILSRIEFEENSGSLIVKHDCRVELYDRISIADTRGT